MPTMADIIPKPVSVRETGARFALTADANVLVAPGSAELTAIGQYLAARLNAATGFRMGVFPASELPAGGNLFLAATGADPALGEEGYTLTVTTDGVRLVANRPAGVFRGVQTLRQLLPPAVERMTPQPGPWEMPTGTIVDSPRFGWRGAMLDVARHFFGVEEVKRFIDLLAAYKMNRLHLHLTDDQGWRIEIRAWPDLTRVGGRTAVGGGPGGYYTQAEYAELVAYAQSRYITLVPEIDMPGHVHAALASIPALNVTGVAPPLFTDAAVGFSSLCLDKPVTFKFVEDVIGEIAALTPGPFFHIGGDEAGATDPADYVRFIARVQAIVRSHGKRMVGWEEIAQAELEPASIVQHWRGETVRQAVRRGVQVIMSPATRAYLDMKYDVSTPQGLSWAGYVNVQAAYTWDPATQVAGVSEADVLGVEAPLWSETLQTMDDVTFMASPRLIGHAEIGWSPASGRNWDAYRRRLGAHSPRLAAMGVNFYPSPRVPWQ